MSVLMVSNGPDAISPSEIARIARECEAVVAVDGGARRCIDAGVTPVLVIGDLDSLDAESSSGLRELGVEFSVHPVLKDRSDLDIALELVSDRWEGDIIVTGVLGGRLDHSMASLGTLAADWGVNVSVVERSLSAWILKPNARDTVHIDNDGTLFSAFGLGDATVTIEGAFWPLDHHPLEPFSSLGLSNRVEGPRATVVAETGTIIVLQPEEIGSTAG